MDRLTWISLNINQMRLGNYSPFAYALMLCGVVRITERSDVDMEAVCVSMLNQSSGVVWC